MCGSLTGKRNVSGTTTVERLSLSCTVFAVARGLAEARLLLTAVTTHNPILYERGYSTKLQNAAQLEILYVMNNDHLNHLSIIIHLLTLFSSKSQRTWPKVVRPLPDRDWRKPLPAPGRQLQ